MSAKLIVVQHLPKFMTSKTFADLSLATEQNKSPSTLTATLHIEPTGKEVLFILISPAHISVVLYVK